MRLLNIFAKKNYSEGQPISTQWLGYSAGISVNPDSVMMASAFNRGVVYLSTQLAKLPIEIKQADKTTIERHSLHRLLNVSPNGEMNAFRFKMFLFSQAIVWGNGYAEIERDNSGRAIALWPIISSHVQAERDSNNKLQYRIVGGSTSFDNKDAIIPAKDIFHLPNIYTKDGINGMSVIQYANEILGCALGSDRFANSLYANGGIPSGVISHPGKLSVEAMQRLAESWKKNHGGRKVGGTAILQEGAKYEQVSVTPDVLQFIDTRKFNVYEIARFLNIPPSKLYAQDAQSYDSQEQSNLEVTTDTVDVWATNFEQETNFKLLNSSRQGIHAEVNMHQLTRGDMNTRSTYYQKMMQNGALSSNEIRNLEGKPGYDGGDRYYIATNNFTPVDKIDEVLDAKIAKDQSSVDNKDESEQNLNNTMASFFEKKAKRA